MRFIFRIVFFLMTPLVFGQQAGIVKGLVQVKSGEFTAITVLNQTRSTGVITDDQGYFSIEASVGDQLHFSSVALKSKILVVGENHLKYSLIILLEEDEIALEEVVLTPYNLSGDLSKDMAQMRVEDQVSEFSLGLPNASVLPLTKSERLLNEATTGGGIIPLNPILNAISGRTKMLKERVSLESQNRNTLKVRYYFSDSLFVKELKIDHHRIDDFMYYCELDPEFNRLANIEDKFALWELMIIKSKTYIENNIHEE